MTRERFSARPISARPKSLFFESPDESLYVL